MFLMMINTTVMYTDDNYSKLMSDFDRRYRVKKVFNLIVCLVITVMGTTSFCYGTKLESMPTIFRWMTVDGTLFTTIGSIIYIAINLAEILMHTEMTRKSVYFIRLSCAVAESLILVVVLFSQMPFFVEHAPLFDRYDSFAMHIMIPILGICSFVTNDSPIGVLRPQECWRGTWFVTCYGAVIFALIHSGVLTEAMIPYFFMDYRHYAWATCVGAVFIYGVAYIMSRLLSYLNRKMSWLWFKNVARKKSRGAEQKEEPVKVINEINLLDKRVGTIIRGIAAILVVLCHIVPRSQIGWEELLLGADWVGVFFFFSGYGLCVSYEEKGIQYRKAFVKRKFKEVFVPFLVAEMAYMLVYQLIRPNWTTPYNGVLWFVFEILGCYALFYLFMLLDERGVRIKWIFIPAYILFMAVCITFFSDMNYIYMSTHCFLAGVYLKPYLSKILQSIIESKYRWVIFSGYWALYILMVYSEYKDVLMLGEYKVYFYILIKMILILMFIPILGIVVQNMHLVPNISPYLEKIPYYIYLWHMVVNLVTRNDEYPLEGMLLCIAATVALSFVLARLVAKRK